MVKSFITSIIILFSVTLIEASILSNINFLIVVPDLILICSIYFSLINGKLYGEITGITSGLFLDFVTGVPLGFNCIFRTIIGYCFGIFSNTIIISGIMIPVLSVGIGTIAKRLLILITSLFFPKISLNIYGFFTKEFLFELIENIVLAPVVFKFLSFFKNFLLIRDEKDMIDNV